MKLGRPPTPVANPFWVKVNKDKREGCVHCVPDYVLPQNTEDDWCYCDCHVREQDFPPDEAIEALVDRRILNMNSDERDVEEDQDQGKRSKDPTIQSSGSLKTQEAE